MLGNRLAGRVAVVTGAGQGVGRGIALALAREGASLLLAGRTLSKCEAVAHEVTELGGTATAMRCDVALRDDVDAAISAAVSEFGGLDALVNNAQSAVQKLLVDTTDADLELSYRTGTLATFYGMQAAYPHLVARGGGRSSTSAPVRRSKATPPSAPTPWPRRRSAGCPE